jgi:hypothetical protein
MVISYIYSICWHIKLVFYERQQEANHIKNLSKGITTTRKQEIVFKANKKSKW